MDLFKLFISHLDSVDGNALKICKQVVNPFTKCFLNKEFANCDVYCDNYGV